MSAAIQLEHQPVATSIASVVVRTLVPLARDGQIRRSDLDAALTGLSVPARDYRAVLDALDRAGLRVIDDPPPATDESSDADPDTDEGGKERPEVGWNVDGFDHFVKSAWHDVLSPEAEYRLATTMQQGRLAREALDAGYVADPATIRVLRRRVAVGDDAEAELVRSNLRLVLKEVKRLRSKAGPALGEEDLFQEGVIGLGHALTKFDPHRGFKLSTYATWWIRQAMNRAIADKHRVIRLPVHKYDQVKRVQAARAALRRDGVEPTPAEIADRTDLPARAVKECLDLGHPIASLDRPMSDSGSTMAELIADAGADPADLAVASVHIDELAAILNSLTEREREILVLRFGLDGGETRTLEQVGSVYGVTRERIRQIEAKTLGKLRANTDVQAMHPSRAFGPVEPAP